MSPAASLKAFARDTCGQLLSLSGLTAPTARLRGNLSILTFHRVLTEHQRRSYPLPGLAVTPGELDAHLRFATRHFQCMPLSAALDVWKKKSVAAAPLLAITFDDGQLDNYVNALPVLEHHGVKASFYIPTQVLDDPAPLWHDALASLIARLAGPADARQSHGGPARNAHVEELLSEFGADAGGDLRSSTHTQVEAALETTKLWSPDQRKGWIQRARSLLPDAHSGFENDFMNVGQLKDLIARGHEIGSHSHSHPLLPQCTDAQLQTEIAGSKRRLEDALSEPVTTFCYPNGSIDQRSVQEVRNAGYQAAVTTQWGSNLPACDAFRLRRFDMNARHAQDRNGRFSAARLAWRMSGWYPGLAHARHDPYGAGS